MTENQYRKNGHYIIQLIKINCWQVVNKQYKLYVYRSEIKKKDFCNSKKFFKRNTKLSKLNICSIPILDNIRNEKYIQTDSGVFYQHLNNAKFMDITQIITL